MTIGIDIDGVLALFTKGYAEILHKVTGLVFPVDDPAFPPEWYWDRAAGVTKEQEREAWKRVKENPTFWLDLDAYPGAFEFLRWLSARQEDDVYFITHRMGNQAKWQSERWLRQHGYIYNPTVLLSPRKDVLCEALDIDFYIDDKPENCIDVYKHTSRNAAGEPKTKVYMQARPYNKQLENIPRGGLEGFMRFVEAG